ncbi:hypothetical protein JX266_003989 [Neoarthrinium moseri]|nr:hypothetical protein JX266_003989 [Neoarthrinium moseri]
MSFNPQPTPRRPSAAPSQRTPASSRFRSSLVPMHRPSPLRSSQSANRVAAPAAPPPRDLFKTATPKPSRTTPFAPNIPPSAAKAPNSIRKFAPKGTGAGLAGTSSQELFKMRIPSPDPDLTGEALANAIPETMSRKGTVYADQYLADKCPKEFDDAQKRQFFCILDLRRLKFAANEIFAKKDWKLNIMNFAKEYEKSRSLIMLRYGLYEFKNVKPSEEVMKKWRKAHNLPEPSPKPEKAAPAPKSSLFSTGTTASKRKAEDDLQPADNTLKTSTVNQNKRRNFEQEPADDVHTFAPSPVKSKRKADEAEETDENQRNKMQKGTPSAARSRLEGIINNVQAGSSTPSGSPSKRPAFGAGVSSTASGASATPLFALPKTDEAPKSAFSTKSNPYGPPSNGVVSSGKLTSSLFQAGQTLNGLGKGSVLSGHKFGEAPATKSSNIFGYLSESSANNSGAENGNDDDADGETDSESESQPETGSQDAPPSYEPSAAASAGTATPPIASGAGGSLFNLGKPAASTPNPFASAFAKPAESSAEKPADVSAKGGLFGRVSFAPNGQASAEESSRAQSPAKETSPVVEATKTPAKTPGDFTFNPTTTPISFSSGSNSIFAPKPAAAPSSEDSTAKEVPKDTEKAASTTSSIFANASAKPAPAEQPTQPLFGAKPSEASTNSSQQPSQSLFGNAKKEAETEKTGAAPPTNSFFGVKAPDQSVGTPKPLFGSVEKAPEAGKAEAPPTAPATSIFGTQSSSSTPFSFGGGAPASAPLFGATSKPTEPEKPAAQEAPKNLFGSQPSFGAPTTTNGASAPVDKEQPQSSFNPFGASNTANGASTPAPAAPLFGGFKPAAEPPKPASSVFGNTNAPSSGNLFGAHNASSGTSLFGAASPNPFGGANSTASTKRSAEDDLHPSKKTMFGKSDTDNNAIGQSSSTPMTFGASQSTMASDTQPEKKSMFGNVAREGTPTNSPVPGRKILTPKRLQKSGASQASQSPAPSAQSSFNDSAMFGSNTAKPDASTSGNMFGNNTSFSFGAQSNASGNGNQNGASSFTFGQSNPQANGPPAGSSSFTFGGGSAPGGGSFTFGAGDSGPSNPFASTSGPPTQSFGGSATPTPSGSFNFQFGGQGASTPAPAEQSQPMFGGGQTNGAAAAPSFSFTSATPQQGNSNAFAPKPAAASLFSGLQPGGAAPGANSPFPAASSINTTPVNGTPEPQQAPQGDDDTAEAPQEQISLTEGGPGEEDEIVLHEVRAKATKYVPVEAGAEDSPAGKSPWKIQGVGPLRMLKNKTTGHVRILLRAEPRGHIAMNKMLISGIEYQAIGKQVKFMAAKDDGSGLETWLLQVKKPESAVELASKMEENKAANK